VPSRAIAEYVEGDEKSALPYTFHDWPEALDEKNAAAPVNRSTRVVSSLFINLYFCVKIAEIIYF
jgi:hypothetical protein